MSWLMTAVLAVSSTPPVAGQPVTVTSTSPAPAPAPSPASTPDWLSSGSAARWPTPALVALGATTAAVVGVGVPLASVPVAYVPVPGAVALSNVMVVAGVLAAPAAAGIAVGVASDTETMLTTMATGYAGTIAAGVVGAVAVPAAFVAFVRMPTEQVPIAALSGGLLFGVVGGVVGSMYGPVVHEVWSRAEEAPAPMP